MYWLLLAVFITFLGNGMHYAALSWITLQSPSGVAGLGLVGLTMYLPYLIWSRPSAAAAQRKTVGQIAVGTDLARGVVVLLAYVVLIYGGPISLTAAVMTFMLHSLSAFFLPTYFTAIALRFEKEPHLILKFTGLTTLVIQVGDIVGALVGGLLLQVITPRTLLLVDGLTYLLSGVLLLKGLGLSWRTRHNQTPSSAPIKAEIAVAAVAPSKSTIVAVSLLGATTATIVMLFNLLAPIIALQSSQSPSLFAIMSGMYAAGAACGGVLVSKLVQTKWHISRLLPFGSVIAVLFIAFMQMSSAWMVIGLSMMLGLFNGGLGSTWRSIPQMCFAPRMIGKLTNWRILIETVLALGVSATMVLLPSFFNQRLVLMSVAIGAILFAMVLLPLPNVRRLIGKEQA